MKAILLAAGLSSRMGRQKLLLPFGGSTVLGTVVRSLLDSGTEIYAVLSRETSDAVSADMLTHTAVNREPERGQSSSLLIGLDMMPDGEDFFIMLGDLPFVTSCDIMNLARLFGELPQGKSVLTPCRDGRFGHPMFCRSVWKERFKTVRGDAGGRDILRGYESEIMRVEAPDGSFTDLDTPEDYKKLLNIAR